jgi:hypothetical protein
MGRELRDRPASTWVRRLVQQRWIFGEPVEDKGLLDPTELGLVVGTLSIYEVVLANSCCRDMKCLPGSSQVSYNAGP